MRCHSHNNGLRTVTRRTFLQQACLGAATLSTTPFWPPAAKRPVARNAIIIMSDTLRRDAIPCYPNAWVNCANLARFAAKSHVFTNCFVGSFPTVPNRNDILTGTFTFTHKDWSPIDTDAVTIQQCLGSGGITTSLVFDTPWPYRFGYGYGLGFQWTTHLRGQIGDRWQTLPKQVKIPCSTYKLRHPRTAIEEYLRNAAHRKRDEDYPMAKTMLSAAEFVEKNANKGRFFLFVDTYDPHEPWDPPKKYIDLYQREPYAGEVVIYPRNDRWKDFLTQEELDYCRVLYAAEATMVDRWIGYLLGRIEELGLLKDTAVFITSDHGFYLGEHDYIGKALIRKDVAQWLPLWPEISHIPLIAHIPGIDGGKIHACLVQPTDLMPTVLDLLGITSPKTIKGRSLMPIFEGKTKSLRELSFSSPAVWLPGSEHPRPSVRTTITDGTKMLIWGPNVENTASASHEITRAIDNELRYLRVIEGDMGAKLYDLASDPHCARNIFSSNSQAAAPMHREFLYFLKASGVPSKFLKFYERL